MKVLFLHPEDSLWEGPWSSTRWDLVVDLGFASKFTYEEWSRRSDARVLSIFHLAPQIEGYRWINQVIDPGRGQLLDQIGLDWWELLSVLSYEDLYRIYLVQQLWRELPAHSDLSATRPHVVTRLVTQNQPVHYFETEKKHGAGGLPRMVRSARKLRPNQILEIAFDKWDPAFRARRRWARFQRPGVSEPVVLIPSAYSNVTRVGLAYAAQLPEQHFLLATTRHNGEAAQLPENVTWAPLAAYAENSVSRAEEIIELNAAWQTLRNDLTAQNEPFRVAAHAGLWDSFPCLLRTGIEVRDAWINLLQSEPVKAVLCGDSLNHYTRLPLVLAKHKGLSAVSCGHGALNGEFFFKSPQADWYLTKGEMEAEYVAQAGTVSREKIVIGAPGPNPFERTADRLIERGNLVFFSQPYEVEGGRLDEIYREIIPRLYEVAKQTDRKLLIKLHPFESKQARQALVDSVMAGRNHESIEILSRVPPERVISQAWCGVTVDSSIAVECTLSGVPCFLCSWLDATGIGYLRQYVRYGAGLELQNPDSLKQLPRLVSEFRPQAETLARLWSPVDPKRLKQIFRSGAANDGAVKKTRAVRSGWTAASPLSLSGSERSISNKKVMWPPAVQFVNRMVYPALGSLGYFQAFASAVNVVTYHGLLPAGYESSDPFLDAALVTPQGFRSQLQLLKKSYNLVSPDQFHRWVRQEDSLPERAIVVSFDDGLLNHLTEALPILQEEQVKALFFVTGAGLQANPRMLWYVELYLMLRDALACQSHFSSQGISVPRITSSVKARQGLWLRLIRELSARSSEERMEFLNDAAHALGYKPGWWLQYVQDAVLQKRFRPLTLQEVKQLSDAGMTIGAHTLSHPTLSKLPAALLRREIVEFRLSLENALGHPVWALAYPFGDPASAGEREYEMAYEAGYECAFVNVGAPDAPCTKYSFPRIHVSGDMSLSVYEAHVSGVHDNFRSRFRGERVIN